MKIRRLLIALLLAAGIVCIAGCGRGGSYRYRDTSTRTVRKGTGGSVKKSSGGSVKKQPAGSKIKKRSAPSKPGSKIKKR